MKQMLVRMALVAGLAGVGAARAEQVYVVEITDLQKKISREIKTSAELKELKKTIDDEARVFPKALELTKKEWETVDKGAPVEKPKPGEKIEKPLPPTPFPSSMLSPRKCQEKGGFTDRDKAQKRLDQLETAEADALAKDAKKKQGGGQMTDVEKNRQARAADRAAAAARAATALQAKIDDLLKNPPGAGGAATPAAAPAAAK